MTKDQYDATRPSHRHGDGDREAPDLRGRAHARGAARDNYRGAGRRADPGLRPARGRAGPPGPAHPRWPGAPGIAGDDNAGALERVGPPRRTVLNRGTPVRIGEVIGRVTLSRFNPQLQGGRFLIALPMPLMALTEDSTDRGEELV